MAEPAFERAFADAIARRGVTLAWLNRRLAERGCPVSVTALSYWRSGRSQPERKTSRDALDEIEQLLGVERGGLSSLIGPSRRPGPQPAEVSTEELFASRPGVLPALRALGFDGLYDELTEELRHITVDIDTSGLAAGVEIRTVMKARRDGARRTPVIVIFDDPSQAPRFIPGVGCSIGRQTLDHDTGVFATEILVDRALDKGDTCLFELSVMFATPLSDTWYDHFAARRLAALLIWVRFDPTRLPARVESYKDTDHGTEILPIPLGEGSSAHVLARGFGPGMLGIRWTW
jgi:hypothetical protein